MRPLPDEIERLRPAAAMVRAALPASTTAIEAMTAQGAIVLGYTRGGAPVGSHLSTHTQALEQRHDRTATVAAPGGPNL
jgi:hypothetical protein